MRCVLHGVRCAERSVRCASRRLAAENLLLEGRTSRAAFPMGLVAKGAPYREPHGRCAPLAYVQYTSHLRALRIRTRF